MTMASRDRGLRWGEGFITPRPQSDGSVRYQARWREGDRWRAKTLSTQDAAEEYLRRVTRVKRDGRYTDSSSLTVADAIADYLARGAGRWAGGTIGTYRQRAKDHIEPQLGRYRLVDLGTADVQRWVDELGRNGLAPATIQPAVAVLSGALKEAVRLGRLDRNVAQGVRLPTVRPPVMHVWSDAQARRIVRASADAPRWRALYQLQLVAFLRPGEVRALAWEDVDLDRAVMHVRRTMAKDENQHWHLKIGTKRGAGRRIALPLPVVVALIAWQKHQAPGAVYVFGDARPLANMTWVRAQKDLCERAKVPVITLHETRHTGITLALERGIHPKIVSEIAGHSRIELTLDRYSHVSLDLQRAATERLADWLNQDTSGDVSHKRDNIA